MIELQAQVEQLTLTPEQEKFIHDVLFYIINVPTHQNLEYVIRTAQNTLHVVFPGVPHITDVEMISKAEAINLELNPPLPISE